MTITARQLNRSTLSRQLLLGRKRLDVVEALRRVVAIQAQEPASPYLALWNRIAGFDPVELDGAFADGRIVKASLMRLTLHAVVADDWPAFHTAMLSRLRASRLQDDRFRRQGVTIDDADGIVADALRFASRPRSNAEMEAWLTKRVGELPEPGLWWALRTYAPVVHAPTGGSWTFGPRPAYVAARGTPEPDRVAAARHLVRRYLEGFGPATAADVAKFTILTITAVREVLEGLAGSIRSVRGPDGAVLFDVPDGSLPAEDRPAPPRLLGMWDSVLLAYAERARVIPDDYRKLVIRTNGDVLPTLLVDGFVAGVWRAVDGGIEARAFRRLAADAWDELAREARGLVTFLADRDPAVYRRYARWWEQLPAEEIRVLPS